MGIKCPECQAENTSDSQFCKKCATPLPPSDGVSITHTLEAPVKKLIRGTTFANRYEILEELGKGGMGEVYKVRDKKLDEEMALKVLKPEIAADMGTIERFKNELKLARKIAHRNVCRMYDLNEEEEIPYITMEYVEGDDLKRHIRKKEKLAQEEAISIAKQVCEGLAEAHRFGVVHRDLKPSNIMIDNEDNAKIMDFGIARSLEAPGVTKAGVMIGTPEYMSPEQVEGKEIDQRSDIYSLGVILYEMITGRVPFEGDTPLSIAYKHKHEPPQDPRKINDQIPEVISSLVLKCLEKDKEKRSQSAREILAELTSNTAHSRFPEVMVTFLFTDIEGATDLLKQLGEGYAKLLADHRTILREVFRKSKGREIDTQGDAVFYAFPRATDAVSAAVEVQRVFAAHAWPDEIDVRIRVGIHTGEPHDVDKEGCVGADVHRAAHIANIGHGGQVLLSEITAPLVKDELPDGVELHDLGDHRLKDLRHPERVFQLVISGLPVDFPSLKSLDAHPNNLPIQPTSFIGRDEDLASARNLMSQAEVRLLTLTGPGGTGKTRLGLQLAAELSEEFPDGIFFVPLAPIANPTLVTSTVAQTLGVRDRGSQPILETLGEFLRSKKMLLFLDNFEHVCEAASEVAQLLETASLIKFLVTSREVLHVRGEYEFHVHPLTFPDLSHRFTVDLLIRNPAVELFSQRAQSVKPEFYITDENAKSVAEICARLDGLPLAIELAAARVKMFPPKALLKRLIEADERSSLHLLARGPRDAPERHRTLRAAMDWSYELLDEDEQRLFQILSVFAGGFTFPAAETVCCLPKSDPDLRSAETLGLDVMEGLASLLDKSLLRQDKRGEDESRFTMLKLIREYAGEKLRESGRETKIRERHANFFLSLAEEAKPMLEGPEQEAWLERLEEEHNNLRSALGWFSQQGEGDNEGSAEAAVSGLRMAGALWRFWDTHGYVSEGRRWLQKMLGLSDTPTNERVDALAGAAELAVRQSDISEASRLYEQGLKIAREISYKAGIAKALGGMGVVKEFLGTDLELVEVLYSESLEFWREVGDKRGIATALGPLAHRAASSYDFEQANKLFEESLALFREVQDKREIAGALWNLGQIAVVVGHYDKAREMYRESLKRYEDLKDLHGVATQLRGLGRVERIQGNTVQARALYEESLASFRTMEDKGCASIALSGLGRVALDQDDIEGAISLIQECLSLSREISFKAVEAQALRLLGQCDLAQGDHKSARKHFIESIHLEQALDHREGIAENLEGIASIAAAQSDCQQAARLFSATEALRVTLGIPLPPVDASKLEKWKAIVRDELGETGYKSAQEEGSTLTIEQAIELVKGKEFKPGKEGGNS
jgi:predicted ATPase/class 3 adenylate cyclase/tRNA A-37 threonylcarbamoyl transferase component Bud32